MSDDKQQPRKRIRIPTPKELDESIGDGQSQEDASQEQKSVRSRVRRFRMQMRGGVGQNKKVLKAPRPDAKPVVREAPSDGQGPGDVESGLSEPSSEQVIGDKGDQIQEDAVPPRQIPGRIHPFRDEFGDEDKQKDSSGSRIRTVKFSPGLKKGKEEPVPVPEEIPKKKLTLEEQACAEARAHAQKYGHEIGDFVPKYNLTGKVFSAKCQRCRLNIDGVVQYVFKTGLVKVGGKAKGQTCKG